MHVCMKNQALASFHTVVALAMLMYLNPNVVAFAEAPGANNEYPSLCHDLLYVYARSLLWIKGW